MNTGTVNFFRLKYVIEAVYTSVKKLLSKSNGISCNRNEQEAPVIFRINGEPVYYK